MAASTGNRFNLEDESDPGQKDDKGNLVATGDEDKLELAENMDQFQRPNIELKVITEVYPEENPLKPERGCQNGA